MPDNIERHSARRNDAAAFGSGAIIGTLGGLIGLGGAEFRLPLLITQFRFHGLEAVILNKAVSLVVVATALPFRAGTVPFVEIVDHWTIILNILCGSLIGAWVGAEWATRLKSATLYRVIAAILVVTAGILLTTHDAVAGSPAFTGHVFVMACFVVGFVIGVIASLLGVAGGEFLIPPSFSFAELTLNWQEASLWQSACPPCWWASRATAATRAFRCCAIIGDSSL